MPETLLSPSNIKLFGRVLTDLNIAALANTDGLHGRNKFLGEQFRADVGANAPAFARIYGFSYEGQFYEMPRPAIFLVHGTGTSASQVPVQGRTFSKHAGAAKFEDVGGVGVPPGEIDTTGVITKSWDLLPDTMFWEYDKSDILMRLDVETGSLDQILLDAVSDESIADSYYGGARVSGARVSGARASGARASGARVSGARLGLRRGRGNDD